MSSSIPEQILRRFSSNPFRLRNSITILLSRGQGQKGTKNFHFQKIEKSEREKLYSLSGFLSWTVENPF